LEVKGKLHEVAVFGGVHVVHFGGVLAVFVFDVGAGLKPVFTFLVVGFLREEGWLHAPVEQTICLREIANNDLDLPEKVWCISHAKRKPLEVCRAVAVSTHEHVELMGVLSTNYISVCTFKVDIEDYLDFLSLVMILFLFDGARTWLRP